MIRLLLVGLLSGCGTVPAADYGRALMSDRTVSSAASNPFSCTTCHPTTENSTALKPGYTIVGAASRSAYWGGFENTLLGAINQCVVQFMRGRALPPTDEKARALYVYLQSLSPTVGPLLPLTVVSDIVDLSSGDPAAGQTFYTDACAGCHGAPHTGQGRLSSLIPIIPDESVAAHGSSAQTGARPITIEKVRHGKFFSAGGTMPLFALERLSDAQLGSILGYLEQFGLPK